LTELDNSQAGMIEWGSSLQFSDLLLMSNQQGFLILCARPAMIIQVTLTGKVKQIIPLDAARLPQPESFCWISHDSLLIGSEGVFGPARLTTLKWIDNN